MNTVLRAILRVTVYRLMPRNKVTVVVIGAVALVALIASSGAKAGPGTGTVFHAVSGVAQTNSSSTVATALSGLDLPIENGGYYSFTLVVPFRSAATATGFCLAFPNTADFDWSSGTFAVSIRQAVEGVGANYEGTATFGQTVCSASTLAANTDYAATVVGNFSALCTGACSPFTVSFRSEVNASTVTVASGGSRVKSLVATIFAPSGNAGTTEALYCKKDGTETDADCGDPTPDWTTITGKPSTFAPDAHTHDDRYFTESESDARFSASGHLHTATYCDADGTEADPDCGGGGGGSSCTDATDCTTQDEFDSYVLASHTCGDPNAVPAQDPCEVGLGADASAELNANTGYIIGAVTGTGFLVMLLGTAFGSRRDG